MRISRRTSNGRGEYELSEQTETGLRPVDLLGFPITLKLGNDIHIRTGVQTVLQGGKPRLRRLVTTPQHIQIHLQVAAALMMPHPVREDRNLAGGLPIMREQQYAIEHIFLSNAQVDGPDLVAEVDQIVLRNFSHHAEALDVADRTRDVELIWEKRMELPGGLAVLVESHMQAVRRSGEITNDLDQLVRLLQLEVTDKSSDLGLTYRSAGEDVVPDLLRSLRSSVLPVPALSVDDVDPNETLIKRRVAREWKRWANSRGVTSARFRQAVREAYSNTCVMCELAILLLLSAPIQG